MGKETFEMGPRKCLLVEVVREPERFAVSAAIQGAAGRPAWMKVHGRELPGVDSSLRYRTLHWCLTLPKRKHRYSPFLGFLSEVEFLVHRHFHRNPERTLVPKRLMIPSLRKILQEAERESIQALSQPERREALRFHPHLRLWLYQKLLADKTGRIAQAARAIPGVLGFAYAAAVRGRSDSLERQIIDGILGGERAKDILDEALPKWLEILCNPQSRRFLYRDFTPFLNRLTSAEKSDLIKRQRLLILSAKAPVSPQDVWILPPLSFAPEDIPRHPHRNRDWFRSVKQSDATLITHPESWDTQLRYELAAFSSRHPGALTEVLGQRRYRLEEFCAYTMITGRKLGRQSKDAAIGRDFIRWMESPENQAVIADYLESRTLLAEGPPRRSRAKRFVQLPEVTPPEGLEIRQLLTRMDLVFESVQMRNCLDQRFDHAKKSGVAYFSARLRRRRLTVQLARPRGGEYVIEEVKGRVNRKTTPEEEDTLNVWLAAVNRAIAEAKELTVELV